MRYRELRVLLQDVRRMCAFGYTHVHICTWKQTGGTHSSLYLCIRIHMCLFVSCGEALRPPVPLPRPSPPLPPRQRFCVNRTIWKASAGPGPGNVNRPHRNITPTGVCGCLQVWAREGERETGRWSVCAGVTEREKEIGLMETEGWKVKVCVCVCVCVRNAVCRHAGKLPPRLMF